MDKKYSQITKSVFYNKETINKVINLLNSTIETEKSPYLNKKIGFYKDSLERIAKSMKIITTTIKNVKIRDTTNTDSKYFTLIKDDRTKCMLLDSIDADRLKISKNDKPKYVYGNKWYKIKFEDKEGWIFGYNTNLSVDSTTIIKEVLYGCYLRADKNKNLTNRIL